MKTSTKVIIAISSLLVVGLVVRTILAVKLIDKMKLEDKPFDNKNNPKKPTTVTSNVKLTPRN